MVADFGFFYWHAHSLTQEAGNERAVGFKRHAAALRISKSEMTGHFICISSIEVAGVSDSLILKSIFLPFTATATA